MQAETTLLCAKPPRSMLFVPADRIDRLDRARASSADWICLDLEDAVASAAKDSARAAVAQLLDGTQAAAAEGAAAPIAVRINAPSSAAGLADILMLHAAQALPAAVAVPKVEHERDLELISAALGEGDRAGPELLAIIETPLGIERAGRIASARAQLAGLAFGFVDYTAATGGEPTNAALAYPRAAVANAAAICSIPALDAPCIAIDDEALLRDQAQAARELGFAGKIAIHPKQVDAINAAFAPREQDVAWARQIVAAANGSGGAAAVAGTMVDPPVIARARRILAAAEAAA